MNLIRNSISFLLILFIRLYKVFFSSFLPNRCRFYPSCSNYAQDAVEKLGPFKGMYMSIKRILKCHPYHPGGIDMIRSN